MHIHVNPDRNFQGTKCLFARRASEGGSSPGNSRKPVLHMVQPEVFLSKICEYNSLHCNKTCIKSKLNYMPNILLVPVQMLMNLKKHPAKEISLGFNLPDHAKGPLAGSIGYRNNHNDECQR